MIICVCGLPGSGKSFFSKRLAKKLKIERLNTDIIRKEMKQLGQYSEDSRLAVYVEMAARASAILEKKQSVILDASFNNEAQRQVIKDLASNTKTTLAFIHSYADEKTSLQRVSKDRAFTEADTRVYYLLKDLWEPLSIPHIKLDSSQQSLKQRLELAVAYCEERKLG